MHINSKYLLPVLLLIILFVALSSCQKDAPDDDQPFAPTPYNLLIPYKFPPMLIPEDNPLTEEGVELGRRLYYDPKLSVNGPLTGHSCSSCHRQEKSFTVSNPGVSVLPHVNLGWNTNFLWDGKIAGTLEDIMKFEVEDFFMADLSAIKADTDYSMYFKRAFGTTDITTERTAYALAQFFRALTSGNSKFDKFLKREVMLGPDEMQGFVLFNSEKGDCFHCHILPVTTDNLFHNIGLDAEFTSANSGRYNITGLSSDIGLFKTPTLRNVELTAPYMHDGRFATLEEVIEHYNSGVKHSPTLDPIMTKSGKEFGLELNEMEKAQLVAFLKTLTDYSFIEDEKLGSPF